MKKATPFKEAEPVATPKDILTEVLRSGAQRMLSAALEAEVGRLGRVGGGSRC